MSDLTQERLKELLRYFPDTGVLVWRERPERTREDRILNTRHAGTGAGCVNKSDGYRYITIDRKHYPAHRLVWLYVYGHFPVDELDHINHDRLDNRIENLREVSHQENNLNRLRASNNTSGTTGVNWDKRIGRWRAYIKVNSRQKELGRFSNLDDAISARKAALIELGFHENHGKVA